MTAAHPSLWLRQAAPERHPPERPHPHPQSGAGCGQAPTTQTPRLPQPTYRCLSLVGSLLSATEVTAPLLIEAAHAVSPRKFKQLLRDEGLVELRSREARMEWPTIAPPVTLPSPCPSASPASCF